MSRTKYYPPSVIRQRTVAEGGKLYNDWKQPGRREILKENLRRQADSGSVRKNVRMAMDIPILDREVLIKKGDRSINPVAAADDRVKGKVSKVVTRIERKQRRVIDDSLVPAAVRVRDDED